MDKKTYVIDIDGTICDWEPGRDYTLASPFPERIKVLNKLYDQGHTLKYLLPEVWVVMQVDLIKQSNLFMLLQKVN